MAEGRGFNPRELLEKHGWTSGSGLGKNEHGMKEAIKVNIKADSAGIGHDAGAEFTFHWWDHVYNTAANSIKVTTDKDGGVLVSKLGDYELSTKKKQAKLAARNLLYGRFVKSATLTNNGQEVKEVVSGGSDSDDSEKDDAGTVSKFTDDQLFQKLGGLTCHKAARHGHKLNGKLDRLSRQERLTGHGSTQPNQQPDNLGNSDRLEKLDCTEKPDRTRREKKRRKTKLPESEVKKVEIDEVEISREARRAARKSRREARRLQCEAEAAELVTLSTIVLEDYSVDTGSSGKKRKRSKKSHCGATTESSLTPSQVSQDCIKIQDKNLNGEPVDVLTKKDKRRKKDMERIKNAEEVGKDLVELSDSSIAELNLGEGCKKTKKKRKS